MSSVTLLVSVCLSTLCVICLGREFPPEQVLSAGEQCKQRLPESDGVCNELPVRRSNYNVMPDNTCRSLKCAVPDGRGGYMMRSVIHPRIGTVCGLLKVCNRNRVCVDIEPHEIPAEIGIRTKRDCYQHRVRKNKIVPWSSNAQ